MRSRAVVPFVAVSVTAVVAVALVAAMDQRDFSGGIYVQPDRVVAVATPDDEVCQRDVGVAGEFDTVELLLGTYGRPGPEISVRVLDVHTEVPLATGTIPAGAPDNQGARVRVSPRVPRGGTVDVCVRPVARRVALYGSADVDVTTGATVRGRFIEGDLRLALRRHDRPNAVALTPEIFRRATIFRPDPVGTWTLWALLIALAVGVPLLLALALRAATPRD